MRDLLTFSVHALNISRVKHSLILSDLQNHANIKIYPGFQAKAHSIPKNNWTIFPKNYFFVCFLRNLGTIRKKFFRYKWLLFLWRPRKLNEKTRNKLVGLFCYQLLMKLFGFPKKCFKQKIFPFLLEWPIKCLSAKN